jgi:hypothetical protein
MARFSVEVDHTNGDAAYTKLRVQKKHEGLPPEVIHKMLRAQAEIVAEEQRKNAGSMLNEKGMSKGYTADSIVVGNPYERDGTWYIQVRFKGTRPDGKRAAEIAYLNEYGIGGEGGEKMRARGFIWQANRSASPRALDAAQKIHDEHVENEE